MNLSRRFLLDALTFALPVSLAVPALNIPKASPLVIHVSLAGCEPLVEAAEAIDSLPGILVDRSFELISDIVQRLGNCIVHDTGSPAAGADKHELRLLLELPPADLAFLAAFRTGDFDAGARHIGISMAAETTMVNGGGSSGNRIIPVGAVS
jgi:hypothetical protein